MPEDPTRPERPSDAVSASAVPSPAPPPPGQLALPLPELPLFQTRAVTPVATGGPMLSSAQALLRRDLWTKDDEGKPVYRRRFSQGRVIEHYITSADPASQYPEALAEQAAWQIVEQFGIPTAYLHLVFAAHAATQPAPWQGLFRLQGSDLIKTLGMEKRTDVAKPEKLKDIAKQAELLGSVGVWVVWREGKRDLNVRASRMWDVAIDVHGQQGPGDATAVPTAVTLTVRPGLWTEKFLNRAGRDAGLALRQFGYLAQAALRINPYHEELAAKLAVYLTIMSRLRATSRVHNLLAAVEPASVLQQAASHRQRRYRFKRRWDEALLTLHAHRWQIDFDPLTYPVAIRPDWALPESLPPHLRQLPPGSWPLLLAATLTLTPPDPIPSLLAATQERLAQALFDDTTPATDIATLLEDEALRVQTALRSTESSRLQWASALLRQVLADAEARRLQREATGRAVLGVPTGLAQLDSLLGGLNEGLYLLAGPPGMGKTTLALQIAAAATREVPVVVVTFEHAPENLTLKLLCARAGVNPRDVQRGYADLAQLRSAAEAWEPVAARLAVVEGSSQLTVAQVRTQARRALRQHQAERCLVVVDYLQLWAKVAEDLRGNFSVRERVDMLGGLLRELALGLRSPVLALASQNRRAGNYGNGKGTAALDSLKESGDLEYAADVVLFLTEAQERCATPPARAVELTVAKNRHGDTGKIGLIFRPDLGTMREEARG